MSLYEILLLGYIPAAQLANIKSGVAGAIKGFGLQIGDEVMLRTSAEADERDPKASTVAAYFHHPGHADVSVAANLLNRLIPLIPVIQEGGSFKDLPEPLKLSNGLELSSHDPKLERLVAALLEAVGLLRQQRRVFISYRQNEARHAALQLHEALSAAGFDAFLDTHDIRPSEPFQEVLWHRMADSDVMIVLDTANYFDSRWTREEFGKAMAREIHILRVIWPGHHPTEHLSVGEMVRLTAADITRRERLKEAVANDIMIKVERLRSRSIAARHRTLTGKLSSEVQRIGARIEAIGAYHTIAVRLSRGRQIWAYPAVGVPTADTLNEIANRTVQLGPELAVLVYDHVGMRQKWIDHLDWLDRNLAVVDAVKVFEAGLRLVDLDI